MDLNHLLKLFTFNSLNLVIIINYCNYCNLFSQGTLRSSQEPFETCLCVPDRIGIWKCWFLRRRENRNTEKPLRARERTNNKLNPHMASTPGFEPGLHWQEATAITTMPPLLSQLNLNKITQKSTAKSEPASMAKCL